MTLVRTRANEVGSPSLRQPWPAVMLRAFVGLVHNVIATLWMNPLRLLRDWHTETADASLSFEKTDPIKETIAVTHDSPIALMLRSAAKLRVSKHDGALTIVSHAPSPLSLGFVRRCLRARPRDPTGLLKAVRSMELARVPWFDLNSCPGRR